MILAPLPHNEAERLAVLHELELLDTPAEFFFDAVVELAKAQFSTPMAALTLIDSTRQVLKAQVGFMCDETSRDEAFCAHTILRDGVMVVHDALVDPRFSDNPLVLSPQHIRFYAEIGRAHV